MKRPLARTMIFLLFVFGSLTAQTDYSAAIKADFNHFFGVGKALLTAPLRIDQRQAQRWALIAGITLALTPVDDDVHTFALNHQSSGGDNLFAIDRYYGHIYSFTLPVGIYLYGLVFHKDRVRQTGLKTAEAFLYAGAITQTLKILIGRRRPENGDGQYFFKPFQWTDDRYQAFPSGHATLSFAMSTVLAKSVDNIYWKIFWYGSAVLVSGARMYHERHWPSDVFFGAVIGYSVGSFVARRDQPDSAEPVSVALLPLPSQGAALTLKIPF